MKDVNYIVSDWEKMKDALNKLKGAGWTDGMIGALKVLSNNLEDVESDIQKYDTDGFISFQHTSQADKYHHLFEDFDVLQVYSGSVGDIIDRTIDQPFYKDIDAFVESMRDISILNYTTENRIGATDEKYLYAGHGVREPIHVPKGEVNLDDLLNGDNFYAEQMNIEYEAWKRENPDQDFSQEEYRQAAVHIGAFEYTSIKNEQQNKEFWRNIISLVVIVGVSIVSPPVGLTLGIAYGGLEIGSAASGKDWISGRELDTQERWIRGGLGPLDIVPGVAGLKRFSGAVRTANLANASQLGITTGLRSTIQHEMRHVGDMVLTAGSQSGARLRNAGAAIVDMPRNVRNRFTGGTIPGTGVNINSTRRIKDTTGVLETKIVDPKYGDVRNYEYNMLVNPGPLAMMDSKPINNFYGGKYNVKVLEEDLILYRAGESGGLTIPGQERNALGQWFTTNPAESVAKVRIDLAVKSQWIDNAGILQGTSPINATYQIKIPKGTTIYEGPVGSQGGVYSGGMDQHQIFIDQPWKIKNLEFISEVPLK